MVMIIEKRNIEDLKPAEYNPRQSTKEQEQHLRKSLEKFGCVEPIVINSYKGRENVIIGGHFRVRELKKLGQEEVDCVIVNLDLEQEKELNVRLNANTGEWDIDVLANNFDVEQLDEWGLNIPELEKTEQEIVDEIEEDEIPEEPEPVVKLGDIWQLGNHRLMCGDSTKESDVFLLMNNKKADLVITDPPYNVNYEGKTKEKLKIKNDDFDEETFSLFLEKVFENYDKIVLKEGGVFYCFYSDKKSVYFINNFAKYFNFSQILIWVKDIFTFGYVDYHWKHESILYGWKTGEQHYFINDRSQSTVFDLDEKDLKDLKKEELLKIVKELLNNKTDIINCDKPLKSDLHPTMKPIRLIVKLIANSSKQDELVVDLFGGSGSTLIACEQLNRRCYTMELDEHYCDVIIARWENLTGQKAVKIN